MSASTPASMPTPPVEDPPSKPTSRNFNVVEHYTRLLSKDPSLTPPIAAMTTLIDLLSVSPPSTISETLSLLSTSTATLTNSVPNPIPLSAGTDLFQRYIITTLQPPAGKKKGQVTREGDDFEAIRAHLLADSKGFVQRARGARGLIAARARRFVREGYTVLTCGNSRVVSAILTAAVEAGTYFRVIYVGSSPAEEREGAGVANTMIRALRENDIPVAQIPFAALATALSQTTFAMVGAESVVENGGIVSSLGTHQLGLLAKSAGKSFYVVAESYKFVRIYPLSGQDLPRTKVLDFRVRGEGAGVEEEGAKRSKNGEGLVDFTTPDLITAIVTEGGVLTPSAVCEEFIRIWY